MSAKLAISAHLGVSVDASQTRSIACESGLLAIPIFSAVA